MANSDRTIVFLHIPRSAGTTLHRIIERHYRAREVYSLGPVAQADIERFNRMPPGRRGRYRMIKGHLAFGRPENVVGPVTWISLLREPLDRAVSFFQYVRAHREEHYLGASIGDGADLAAFLREQEPRVMDNCQTRMISGAWLDPAFGACTEEMLERAKANLQDHFAVVGLTEKFDETLLMLQRHFGWRWLYYRKQNTGRDRVSVDRLSPGEREWLEETNRFDTRLYRYAVELFEQQVKQLGPNVANDVEAFRAANRPYPVFRELFWSLTSRTPGAVVRAALRRFSPFRPRR